MLVSSFEPTANPSATPARREAVIPDGDLSFDKYQGVFERVPAGRCIIGSLAAASLTVFLGPIVTSMADVEG